MATDNWADDVSSSEDEDEPVASVAAIAETKTPAEPPIAEACPTFDAMELPWPLLRGIYGHGFEKPSKIQQSGIPLLVAGRDLVAQSQSGTGKTAFFAIGAMASLFKWRVLKCGQNIGDPVTRPRRKPDPHVIVVAPTRELAAQHASVFRDLGRYVLQTSDVITCHGGAGPEHSVRRNCDQLRRGGFIVCGTPGRLIDLVERGALRTDELRLFILDEADQLLDLGFDEQLHALFGMLPSTMQVVVTSATLTQSTMRICEEVLRDPVRLLLREDELTLEGITQYYVACGKEEWKLDTLCDLYACLTIGQSIIYVNTRARAQWLQRMLEQRHYPTGLWHGDMTQPERDKATQDFRGGQTRILVATDGFGRGIDVQSVSVVMCFDVPTNRENYIHRIGRSGRFGRKGVAINLVDDADGPKLRDIEQFYSTQISELPSDVEQIIHSTSVM